MRNVAYRENVATEIFKTEEDYVKSLRIVFTAYLDPIKEHMDDNKWKAGPKGEEVLSFSSRPPPPKKNKILVFQEANNQHVSLKPCGSGGAENLQESL